MSDKAGDGAAGDSSSAVESGGAGDASASAAAASTRHTPVASTGSVNGGPRTAPAPDGGAGAGDSNALSSAGNGEGRASEASPLLRGDAHSPGSAVVNGWIDGDGDGSGGHNGRAASRRAAAVRKTESIGIAGGVGPGISTVASVLSLVRASVGPGAMALPYAFSQSGIAVGLALLVVMTAVILTNMFTLVALKRRLPGAQTYADVGTAVLGRTGRVLVEVSLTGMELGICTVYFDYVATNLGSAVGLDDTRGRRKLMLALLPVLGALGLVTRMRAVAALSSVANVLMACALVIVWFYLVLHTVDHGVEEGAWSPNVGEIHHVLLTLATVIYAFEGCGAVLPIENATEAPDQFGVVLWVAFATFFVVYFVMGVAGAMAFDYMNPGMDPGDRGSVSAVIAFYYPHGAHRVVSKVLNALLATTVAMTYPIQFYAAIEVIEVRCGLSPLLAKGLVDRRVIKDKRWRRAARVALRLAIVSVTMVLAYAVPKLSLIIALFGAVFGGMIELVLPPLLYLWWRPPPGTGASKQWNDVLVNRAALAVGVVAVLGGTAQALLSIVESM